jgi:hypothetical protein
MSVKSSSASSEAGYPPSSDFSVVLGGPLFQMLRRARLTDDDFGLLYKRILTITLFAWLPLLVLSTLEERTVSGTDAIPFLRDFEVQARFLVALPILIFAEYFIHHRMRSVVQQFLERNLIPTAALPKFNAAVASALRLRDSVTAETVLLPLVYVVSIAIVWRQYAVLGGMTWYAIPAHDGPAEPWLAGAWYRYVSMPIFQFLLLRWYFRIIIWSRFLWQVCRIDLSLIPTHPDHMGGLGFLTRITNAFSPLVVAHSALVAGLLANRIFYRRAALLDFKIDIAILVVLMLCMIIGPLLIITPQLARTKRRGNREYGTLAERYVREFDAKWLRGGAPAGESFLGSGDIQSLADLNNSLEIVQTMHFTPITKDLVLRVVATTLIPIAPLGLTIVPMEQLVKIMMGIML